ncbi:MAG TPA: 4Fe-4S dicluster domain-containing protein [Bacteroidota bacterium]|nr:4Fe-4S dicluster domain-containing protein [Bacteroidota bacterium]
MKIFDVKDFQKLLDAISARGYVIIGPTARDGAIMLDEIRDVGDLPRGITDVQSPASYALKERGDDALFGYRVSPVAWKRFLFEPRLQLFAAVKSGKGFTITPGDNSSGRRPMAFLGVRSCELEAIAVQDKVFSGGEFQDRAYAALREGAFIVAVNCVEAGGTCFCASMGTGPKATHGYDIVLTELLNNGQHRFMAEAGSSRGEELLGAIPGGEAQKPDIEHAEGAVASAARQMGRTLDTDGIKDLLYRNSEHQEWNDVAKRCLACTNCTLVCPTCFCSSVEDITDLQGDRAERWRRWDSCFTLDFAKVAGGNTRPSVRARYRQWLTHKLAYWIDQFGTSGCVGCGRCITWCPVGIDITAEVDAIRRTDSFTTPAGAASQRSQA